VRGHWLWQRNRNACFFACQDLLAAEVASVSDCIEILCSQRRFGVLSYRRELRPVSSDVGHLMGDDQMMYGVDGDLDIVADDTGASTARRHRAGIGIGQRYLLIRSGEHLHLENLDAGGGYTYFNPQTGHEFSAVLGFTSVSLLFGQKQGDFREKQREDCRKYEIGPETRHFALFQSI
jgi:hypothetical protein